MRRLSILLILVSCALGDTGSASAAQPARHEGGGEIRVWGSPVDRPLIEALEAAFARQHRETRFSNRLYGPESTIAGVYTGAGDIAFMAREIREPMERMAFEWALLVKPFSVEIATAGFSPDRPSSQLAVYVHRDNPLTKLSLAQLDGILGAEQRPGRRDIRTWGELGLGGAWAARPIRVYGPAVDSIAALFVRRRVMNDSRKWNPDYRQIGSDAAALAALEADPAGIAIAAASSRSTIVKAMPLSGQASSEGHPPTAEAVASRAYPLSRAVTVVVHRPDKGSFDPKVAAFLRFVLGEEGQAIIARDGSYLPLSRERAAYQLGRLK